MLTQLELLTASGTAGNDDDSGMSLSPLDGLSEYPIEQTEFEYFESNLASDSYYDVSPAQDIQDSLPPPPCLTPTTPSTTTYSSVLYDTALTSSGDILHGHNDMGSFEEDLKPLREALESPHEFGSHLYNGNVKLSDEKMKFEFPSDKMKFDLTDDKIKLELSDDKFQFDLSDVKVKFEDDTTTYDAFSSDVYDNSITADDFNLGRLYDTFDANLHASETTEIRTTYEEGACKGKIGPLQRRALDSIFSVTEKPSRGLVLHIAGELGLHHMTVKNFFSNGRRRLRRAAARLNDPERTRRENERRKEKRRSHARAVTSGECKAINTGSVSSVKSSPTTPAAVESPPPKETTYVSLERRALMEKLADKVQRSKAQRSLASDLGMLQTTTTSQDFLTHTTQDLLLHPANDILSQASQDILSHSTHGLLNELPQDFLVEPTHDLSQSSSSLLNPNTDPWNFF